MFEEEEEEEEEDDDDENADDDENKKGESVDEPIDSDEAALNSSSTPESATPKILPLPRPALALLFEKRASFSVSCSLSVPHPCIMAIPAEDEAAEDDGNSLNDVKERYVEDIMAEDASSRGNADEDEDDDDENEVEKSDGADEADSEGEAGSNVVGISY